MIKREQKYGITDIIRIPFQCAPYLTIFVGLQMLLSGLVPTIQIIVTAYFIDTAISIVQDKLNIALIFPSLFAVVALIAYTWISNESAKFFKVLLEKAIREKFRTAIVEKRAKLEYKHIENHETWDIISRVSKEPEQQIQKAFNDVLSTASLIIRIVGILFLLITQVWWAALLILAISIPLFILSIKSGRANYQANREVSKYKRKNEYLTEVLTGREAINERTLFKYGKEINDTWYSLYETARKIEFKTESKWFIKMKTGSILTALISIIIIIVLLNPVLTGQITIGMFISLVNGIFGLMGMMSWQLTNLVDQLAKHVEYLKDLTDFAALEESEGMTVLPASPAPMFHSLEFKNVKFTYPGTKVRILDGVSFKITPGKHYAFVGVNGAGKTTITKLITGLYNNFEGEIYLNGKEIRTYSQSELKSFYSVVYQDFAKYYITMKENIAVGHINRINDPHLSYQIRNTIENIGLNLVEKKLDKGLDTPLGKIKPDGQDVSGGEWQRIVMARAVLNPAPIRILDEPTSALDPLSESRLYEEFEQISKNKTTLFISHRLGSTKLADEIYVISDGHIREHGSHSELMGLSGIYAEMYEKQRSWYQ